MSNNIIWSWPSIRHPNLYLIEIMMLTNNEKERTEWMMQGSICYVLVYPLLDKLFLWKRFWLNLWTSFSLTATGVRSLTYWTPCESVQEKYLECFISHAVNRRNYKWITSWRKTKIFRLYLCNESIKREVFNLYNAHLLYTYTHWVAGEVIVETTDNKNETLCTNIILLFKYIYECNPFERAANSMEK